MLTMEKISVINDWITVVHAASQDGESYKKIDPYRDCILAGLIIAELEPNHDLFTKGSHQEKLLLLDMMTAQWFDKIAKMVEEEEK